MDVESLAEEYERNGVVRVPNLLSPEKTDSIRLAIKRYTKENLSKLPSSDYVLESDGETVRNFWRMDKHDPYFSDLVEAMGLEKLIPKLVQGETVVLSVESFNKPARIGSAVPPHQDNAYFCFAPADALTVWIAIDEVTKENGPTHYIPGSHGPGHKPHIPSAVPGNSMGLKDSVDTESAWAPLLMPGDALIHHCETIHFSASNTSEQSRLGLLVVYRAAHCSKDKELLHAYEQGH